MKTLVLSLLLLFINKPVLAAQGLGLSLESLLAPLNKQVERWDSEGNLIAGFGRETTEFTGISGFSDLNLNWRLLYGLQAALPGYPLFKGSGSLALMINTDYPIPLRPYLFAGLDTLLTADPALEPLSLASHGGLGVEYSWNNRLHVSFEFRSYFNNPYQRRETSTRQLIWPAGSFSLGMRTGFFY